MQQNLMFDKIDVKKKEKSPKKFHYFYNLNMI